MKLNYFSKLLFASIAIASLSTANAFSVSPVKIEFQPGQRASQLNFVNDSDEVETIDIRIEKWLEVDQTTGRSKTEPLTDSPILLSKPVVTLQPHTKATVRLAINQRTNNDVEFYRIKINDISTNAIDTTKSEAKVKISYSLPALVKNSKYAIGNLTFTPNSEGKLIVKNDGNSSVLFTGLRISETKIDTNLNRYLLPGQVWNSDLTNEDLPKLVWSSGIQ
jgi:P pilus assembly chaperone PapD